MKLMLITSFKMICDEKNLSIREKKRKLRLEIVCMHTSVYVGPFSNLALIFFHPLLLNLGFVTVLQRCIFRRQVDYLNWSVQSNSQ